MPVNGILITYSTYLETTQINSFIISLTNFDQSEITKHNKY